MYGSKSIGRVIIHNNFLFSHATARFNFTGYDVRRDQDAINVNSDRRDIVIPSFEPSHDANGEPTHPYWYAHILGIYHANIHFDNSQMPERMDFLWVRWFGQDPDWKGGPSSLRLDRIGFVSSHETEAFGFLDPSLVIRACHLIPAFTHGRTYNLLAPSFARKTDGDWQNYYVMRHVTIHCIP